MQRLAAQEFRATCRLNSMLWDRCFAMGFHPSKARSPGQFGPAGLSGSRGPLQEHSGLAYADFQPIYLGPADAGAAFERGAIDAWAIWDPYYALFETRPGIRVLAKRTGSLNHRQRCSR